MSKIVHNLALARSPLTPAELLSQSAIKCSELGISAGDVYGDYSAASGDDSWLRRFENEISYYFGKEAAIFLPSGVMAQNIALKISQKKDTSRTKFICHHTSHLLIHEQNAYQELLCMSPYVVNQPAINGNQLNSLPIAYEDVKSFLALDGKDKPTALIVELPHRGNDSLILKVFKHNEALIITKTLYLSYCLCSIRNWWEMYFLGGSGEDVEALS